VKSLLATCLLMLPIIAIAQNNAPPTKGLSQIEIAALLATGSTSDRIAKRVQDRGIEFMPDDAFLKALQADGATEPLLAALKSATMKPGEPSTQNAGLPTGESEALAHLHRAAQLNRNNFHPREAEPEFVQAKGADPTNPFVHLALGEILERVGSKEEGIAEFRAALNLQPDIAEVQLNLGEALLGEPGQHREALEHLQRAVALDPSYAWAHSNLATALDMNGDKEGAAEQRKIADGLGARPVPVRIRVGGQMMQSKLISQSRPQYPKKAKASHIEGKVRLNVMLGEDGVVKDIEVIEGDPLLAEAAVKAVSKWRYQPTTLNHIPVEVISEVDVNFTLK